MQFIKPDVSTICVGQAASMGAVLLAGGAKGKRYCLPHSRVMIHQPLGGFQGQAADIEIHAREILETRERLNEILAKHTGQTVEQIKQRHRPRQLHDARRRRSTYGLIDTRARASAASVPALRQGVSDSVAAVAQRTTSTSPVRATRAFARMASADAVL